MKINHNNLEKILYYYLIYSLEWCCQNYKHFYQKRKIYKLYNPIYYQLILYNYVFKKHLRNELNPVFKLLWTSPVPTIQYELQGNILPISKIIRIVMSLTYFYLRDWKSWRTSRAISTFMTLINFITYYSFSSTINCSTSMQTFPIG